MTGVTIAEQVAAMAAATAGQPPREVMDVMAHERAELAARGIPEGIVSPQRPDGSLSMRAGGLGQTVPQDLPLRRTRQTRVLFRRGLPGRVPEQDAAVGTGRGQEPAIR